MKYLKPLELCSKLLKSNDLERGRLLGVDVLPKCVCIAVSDWDNKKALTLTKIVRPKTRVVADLQSFISEYSVSGMVIGYPFERELGFPTAGERTKRFVDDLTRTGKFEDMNYTFWDETLKSKAAEQALKKKFKLEQWLLTLILEDCAALKTLQGYLDFVNGNQHQTFVGEHGHMDFGTKI